MKALLFLFSCLLALNLTGQCPFFQKYMDKGDAEMKKDSEDKFKKAIDNYSIAMVHCSEKADEAQKRIVKVFEEINKLKKEAEAGKIRVDSTLNELEAKNVKLTAEEEKAKKLFKAAEDARILADSALSAKLKVLDTLRIQQDSIKKLLYKTQVLKDSISISLKKAKDLINAYYFYDDKFALAFNNGKYYYIDKTGKAIENLGRWDRAEQFSAQTGYAKVGAFIFNEMKYYLLDTLGKYYPTINNNPILPFSNNPYFKALDLSEKRGFPFNPFGVKIIGKLEDIEVLIVNTKIFTGLNKLLKKFINLEKLDLSDNDLKTLPNSIYDLKYLKYLDLRNNPLSEAEKIKIFRLLPECKIDTGQYYSIGSNFNSQINYKLPYEYLKTLVAKKKKNHQNWYNLSQYALLNNIPKEAIQAAQKALTLAPKKQSVETKLATGYLLDNQWDKAEEIYLRWKGKNFPDNSELCDDLFLEDIADLEQTGITHSDFQKVKDLFRKKE